MWIGIENSNYVEIQENSYLAITKLIYAHYPMLKIYYRNYVKKI